MLSDLYSLTKTKPSIELKWRYAKAKIYKSFYSLNLTYKIN